MNPIRGESRGRDTTSSLNESFLSANEGPSTSSFDVSHSSNQVIEEQAESDLDMEKEVALYKSLRIIAGVLSGIIAIISVAGVAYWASGTDSANNMLGGLDFHEHIFNWHPVLMVGGMITSAIFSLTSYKILPLPKWLNKIVHVIFHTFAIVCIVLGVYCVAKSNGDPNYNTTGLYYPNLLTLHSFLGLAAIMLYFQNYSLGILYYLLHCFSLKEKIRYMPNHVFLGIVGLFVSCIAVESGHVELVTRMESCIYEVTGEDYNPSSHYHRLKTGCLVANAVGMLILVAVLLCVYAVWPSVSRAEKSK